MRFTDPSQNGLAFARLSLGLNARATPAAAGGGTAVPDALGEVRPAHREITIRAEKK